ncbi:aldehyde dehydrogenase (NADP(+)) [Jiulongibacter sediminis]|uniref:2,5-dioxovalerate dehydrogenase n=1 Tax=Jiulongibacter sediminis TaxID=1605367 RepID=A0A0P7BDH6_9BACT|nr:aldehyde dehydrogenase (NADP(+)) [Jiulongibacter sediminis]KPM48768.1 2,5-dioxovalerate dehydrogenase [Jiulongibacter sediminis]TBX25301.1 2,5-dioxovalerate dehydrogenase [Jiulongibacter sediminis]
MDLQGVNIIGFGTSSEGTVALQAVNPVTGDTLGPLFYNATKEELESATDLAEEAFLIYRKKSGKEKAAFLKKIAEEIEALDDQLIERYSAETGLPAGRAQGERGRTCGQLRLFASLIEEGSWVNAKIDPAMPDRQPLPRVDIRSMERPLGPVAVFGASNFPLAFSVAGGDTASALAAGCPVVFKAHPAHLGTSELVGKAIQKAAKETGMPNGVFSMIHADADISQALVMDPKITAVGFTGSYKVGKLLFDKAAARPKPIPVYSEMGSTNPVFILPKTLEAQAENLAESYVNSVNMGVGQFCTNPGIMLIQKNQTFLEILEKKAKASAGGNMLTPGIRDAYIGGVENAKKYTKVIAVGTKAEGLTGVEPTILYADYQTFKDNPHLDEEVFGPTSLVVEGNSKEEYLEIARNLSGHLTATVHGTEEELIEYAELLEILEQKVGRLIINGFPTGVEVCHAMVHGGPFPATTDSRSTSVGTGAITRFTRPICYQNLPDSLLPDELKTNNPLGIWRLIDGEMKQ